MSLGAYDQLVKLRHSQDGGCSRLWAKTYYARGYSRRTRRPRGSVVELALPVQYWSECHNMLSSDILALTVTFTTCLVPGSASAQPLNSF